MRKKLNPATKRLVYVVGFFCLLGFYFLLPTKLFNTPTSTVLYDRNGELLSAKIADDGQWRFPESSSVPELFKTCILTFEDEYFYSHIGVNPISIFHALQTNWVKETRKRGGSTLTMQIMRLARKQQERSIYQKIIETSWALRSEWRYTKEELLNLYCSHAPFGGNVVGLDAASWRYFGRPANQLSWAESACLAVLPNAPALIFPGKNHDRLKKKRDFLLKKIHQKGLIESETLELALIEPLPQKPFSLPQRAAHLIQYAEKKGKKGKQLVTTLDKELQSKVTSALQRHHAIQKSNGIMNGAVLVVNNTTHEVLSYVGNTSCGKEHSPSVDIIQSARSSGSILKPFLYMGMLQDGLLMPKQLVADIPINFGGYTPQNFDYQFRGAVPADQALATSLNIPAVNLLKEYGIPQFHSLLKKMQFTTIKRNPDHYGLSLILGGAEVKLWELVQAYSSLGDSLSQSNGRLTIYPLRYGKEAKKAKELSVSSAVIEHTLEAIQMVKRPYQEQGWESFVGGTKMAWKTGTSFGFRDAWAVGITPTYTIGVWMGNADGEGRPGLTGVSTAAPLLFKVANLLDEKQTSFTTSANEKEQMKVCERSGMKANSLCEETKWEWISKTCETTSNCHYCTNYFVTPDTQFRLENECAKTNKSKVKVYFTLPPLQEWYYKKRNSSYQKLPSLSPLCSYSTKQRMAFEYPISKGELFLPIGIDGKQQHIVCKVVHAVSESTVYWYVDDEFKGVTTNEHTLPLHLPAGKHTILVVDEKGEELSKKLTIKTR
ncbi:MAG: penicillin-binding protein 1C [Cyclobacteriaceae bacterium]